MTKLEWAMRFHAMGIAVIPLRHRGKEPEAALMGGSWERYKTELPTEYQLRNWLASDWQNYGVVAGECNSEIGLTVLDFDDMRAFAVWSDYFAVMLKHGVFADLPFMVRSNRGVHVYVRMAREGLANQKRLGVDFKVHGYVVGPQSTHPSGAQYMPMSEKINLPVVFSLDAILPAELFPHMAPVAAVTPNDAFDWASVTHPVQLDAFAIASGGGEDVITKIKRMVRIEDLFPDKVPTSADRRWWSARCPFHADERPSFWIDAKRQLCGCQVCGMKPMDAINLYARMKNIPESQAVSALGREVGVWV